MYVFMIHGPPGVVPNKIKKSFYITRNINKFGSENKCYAVLDAIVAKINLSLDPKILV